MQPRIYTYKITFEEVPYYYYGVKKEKYYNQEYWGSPVTHKWYWELYTPKKQILQLFEFTDEGWLEALEIERRLIKPVYNIDKLCLNEHCGGNFSLSTRRRNGEKTVELHKELKIGLYGLTTEQRKKNSKRMVEEKRGYHKLSSEEKSHKSKQRAKIELESKTGMYKNLSANGKRGAEVNRKNGTGLWGITKEQFSENGKRNCSQKWKCTVTGYISNAGALANYQRHRGIDISNRIRIQ